MTVKLKLNPRADAYGWVYGDVVAPDGEVMRVDIMPPREHWAGDMYLEGYEPHDSEWVLYAEGEEVARVTRRDELETIAARLLASK